LGPIPWNQIRDYAEWSGLERDVAFAFATIIRKLDAYYLDAVARQQEIEAGRARGAAGVGGADHGR
jgi:hypothetical protein